MRFYQTPDVGGEVVLRCVSMYDVMRAVIPINAAERFAWMVSWDTDMGFSNVPTGRRLHAHLTTLGRHNGYVDRWWQACWRSSLQRRRAMPERYALHAYICLACCMQCKNVSTCRPGDLNNNHSNYSLFTTVSLARHVVFEFFEIPCSATRRQKHNKSTKAVGVAPHVHQFLIACACLIYAISLPIYYYFSVFFNVGWVEKEQNV